MSQVSDHSMRHIQPLGPRVLVKIEENSERTPSGLYLPQGIQEKHQVALYAQVVEVARDSLRPRILVKMSLVSLSAFLFFSPERQVSLSLGTKVFDW